MSIDATRAATPATTRPSSTARVIPWPRTSTENPVATVRVTDRPAHPEPAGIRSRLSQHLLLARAALCLAGGASGPALACLLGGYDQQANR